MSHQNKLIYQYLQEGDKLEQGDEYSASIGTWREVPDFLIGDKIPKSQSDTQWRRLVSDKKLPEVKPAEVQLPEVNPPKAKKHWYSFKK
jgi:hypothetical protein